MSAMRVLDVTMASSFTAGNVPKHPKSVHSLMNEKLKCSEKQK